MHRSAFDPKPIIKTICEALPDVQAIYLFGSTGSKYERPESDIDIAILPVKKLPPKVSWELAQQLASILDKDVDVIDLLSASTVMNFQIIHTGTRIFCQNEFAAELFATTTFSEYIKLNELRKDIIADIKQRGKVL